MEIQANTSYREAALINKEQAYKKRLSPDHSKNKFKIKIAGGVMYFTSKKQMNAYKKKHGL